MSSAEHVHSANNNKSSWARRSSWSPRRQQVAVGVTKYSISSSILYPGMSFSNYASSLQGYHLRVLSDLTPHAHQQFKQSDNIPGISHPSYPSGVNQSFRYKYVTEAFQPPDAVTSPIPINDMQLEQTYLLSSLQREDRRATDMLKQIQLVQQRLELPLHATKTHQNRNDGDSESLETADAGLLPRPFPQVNKRKLTRQLQHLKNRLIETTKQEKYMLARVEEVASGILKQRRWQIPGQEGEIWGFADSTNLHTYNGLSRFQLGANAGTTNGNGSGRDTPGSGVSPRTQTPIKNLNETSTKKALDPRSPTFIPRTPLLNCLQPPLSDSRG